ncbi:hypothetical protein F441_03303 [Phytophthora nicotianae CJ01A1]|nr:hypothetical protein F441_03303 [Phytophthora nicotianae CJ01A1]
MLLSCLARGVRRDQVPPRCTIIPCAPAVSIVKQTRKECTGVRAFLQTKNVGNSVSTLLDIERNQKPIAQQSHYHRAPLIEVDADADSVYGNASSPVMYREFSIPGAGYGVFAAEDLEPGDIVTWYSGDLMNSEPSDKIYVTAISGGFINGLRKPVKGEGLASFVNRETRDMSMQREKL